MHLVTTCTVFWAVLKMVENNDVQDKIVIRQALKIDAETVFKIIRSFAKYHGEGYRISCHY